MGFETGGTGPLKELKKKKELRESYKAEGFSLRYASYGPGGTIKGRRGGPVDGRLKKKVIVGAFREDGNFSGDQPSSVKGGRKRGPSKGIKGGGRIRKRKSNVLYRR